MRTAVIIITYNAMRNNWINNCLSALSNSVDQESVYIVDNFSADGTVQFIEDKYSGVKLIKESKNNGFGKANNIAIEAALRDGYDLFFLLNQDAYVKDDTISLLEKAYQKNPEFGIISPIHLNGNGTGLDKDFAELTSPPWCIGLYSDFAVGKVKNTLYELFFINAAAWMVTKSCLRKVGGFSPVFYHYGEDNNFAHRAIFHGFKIGICAQAHIFHDRLDTANPFFNPVDANVRHKVVEMSNPLHGESFYHSNLYLYTQLFFNRFVSRNSINYKVTKQLLRIQKTEKNTMMKFLKESKSTKPFKFLNYSE